MPLYMIIYAVENDETVERETKFFDTYFDAKQFCMNVECGLGGYWELYYRQEHEGGLKCYEFLEG